MHVRSTYESCGAIHKHSGVPPSRPCRVWGSFRVGAKRETRVDEQRGLSARKRRTASVLLLRLVRGGGRKGAAEREHGHRCLRGVSRSLGPGVREGKRPWSGGWPDSPAQVGGLFARPKGFKGEGCADGHIPARRFDPCQGLDDAKADAKHRVPWPVHSTFEKRPRGWTNKVTRTCAIPRV